MSFPQKVTYSFKVTNATNQIPHTTEVFLSNFHNTACHREFAGQPAEVTAPCQEIVPAQFP